MSHAQGPLAGVKIVELTGIGPVPYAAMLMADLGAQVIRIDRPGGYPSLGEGLDLASAGAEAIFHRSRPMVQVDLKSDAGRALVLDLVAGSDALIEGYRPGTLERLSLGPADCHAVNPALAFVRVTGWGQTGPMAQRAGHDLNYLAQSGALSLFGRDGAPPVGLPPLVGDMAGGALFAVIGLLSAVMHARATGTGQVVDANIVDGSASLYTLLSALGAMGGHGAPGTNPLDGGRHFYRTYACADGGHVAVGAIEPAFRRVLLERLGLSADPRMGSERVEDDAACAQILARIFASAPRDHWAALFADTDGCVTAVLDPSEAQTDPASRDSFTRIDGVPQAAPAPRFTATPGAVSLSGLQASVPSPHALGDWGIDAARIDALVADGVLAPDIEDHR